MALLDVSEVLESPEFIDAFEIVRRAKTVNDFGELELVESKVVAYGSMQSATAQDFEQGTDYSKINGAVKVFSKSQLKAESDADYADVIVWRGVRYFVKSVENWANFGAGFYVAVCQKEGVKNG